MISGRWSRMATLAWLLGCFACEQRVTRREESPIGRFWLQHAELRVPGAPRPLVIDEAVLVDLYPDGMIRGCGDPWVQGEWPLETLPESRRGLMLYAQREAKLLTWPERKESGAVLYPGALVAVRPEEDGFVVAPDWPAPKGSYFVAKEVLHHERPERGVAEACPEDGPRKWAVRYYEHYGTSSVGRDILWDPDTRRLTQCAEGVQMTINVRGDALRGDRPFDIDVGMYDRLIIDGGAVIAFDEKDGLVRRHLTSVLGVDSGQEPVDDIPAAMRERRDFQANDPLSALLRGGGVITLMTWQGRPGMACESFRARDAALTTDGWIEGVLEPVAKNDGILTTTQFYLSPDFPGRGRLVALSPPLCAGHRFELYELVWWNHQEATLSRDALGKHVIAYEIERAERWFLSPSHCEEALTAAKQRHQRDRRTTMRLGLHGHLFHYRDILQ